MPEQRQGEKDEKELEKRDEKHDEKHDEKSIEEKYRRDPLGTLMGAVLLIWVGVFFLAKNLGVFQEEDQAWMVLFLGGAAIVLLEVVIRLLVPAYRRPVGGSFVFAAALVGLGIGFGLGNWAIIGPLILVGIGLSILFGGRLGRGQ